nr:hypothetical protein [uncultured Sphingomonas sp.]
MIIMMKDAPAQPGGKCLMLCNDDGTPVPMQVSSVLEQQVGDAATFTVTLAVDGQEVRLA